MAHDTAHPQVTGGDALGQLLAEALADRGDDVELWTAGHPTLPRTERARGVRIRRFAPGLLLAPSTWVALRFWAGRHRGVVVEQVIGSQRLPFFARLVAGCPVIGMWYQDNVPLFRATYPPGLRRVLAEALQALLLLVYRRGPLVTCSVASRRWLLAQGLPDRRVGIVYPRTRPPPSVRSTRPFAARHNRFVVIGNIRPTKRFEEALDVLRHLIPRVPDATCAILGRPQDPAYLDSLRDLARAPELQGHVEFVLGRSDLEKFELLATSKALTVHSAIEGFGWTLLEAGVVGVPVIVNSGVPPDALDPGPGGVRVAGGDVAAYADALAEWMRSEKDWTRASESVRGWSQRFDRPLLTPELLAFLDGVRPA